MANQSEKLPGEERRKLLVQWLEDAGRPITGKDLADKTNVSRQVIVQDMSLLKAKNHPILATSQGYVMLSEPERNQVRRQIACFHSSDLHITEEELNIMVDHGARVIDVSIEHPFYGDITAPLMLSSRRDVKKFIQNLQETNAPLLSELTDGTHLHTIEADSTAVIEEVKNTLEENGFLLT
ncbi:3H domain-containing protein [Salibacterium sp. K-3]